MVSYPSESLASCLNVDLTAYASVCCDFDFSCLAPLQLKITEKITVGQIKLKSHTRCCARESSLVSILYSISVVMRIDQSRSLSSTVNSSP